MRLTSRLLGVVVLVVFSSIAFSAATAPSTSVLDQNGPAMFGKVDGKVFAACENRVVILHPDGSIAWEHKTAVATDAWMLPNGNVLFGDGSSITEVTPDHKTVFQFKSSTGKGDAVYGCQRLADGNTLIGENATGKVLEVDPQGKIVFELQTLHAKPGNHHNLRMVRKLENGNYLVCHSGEHVVREYRPDAKVVWEQKVDNIAFAAIRKPNGNTLISSLDKIQEFTPKHEVVWEFKKDELSGITINNMTGLHLLDNGHLVVGCYSAYKNGEGNGLFEITSDKKLVWRFSSPKTAKTMMAVQKLDADGKVLNPKPLR